ncbi:hypothetical protein KBX37_02635 [Micromonospora sp. U56]|uniref:hypothetical protein n=1 Tax=Micromonospora sp. U56 TaxID=2824900 RepID=UPI001B366628|nr:hypothetical protein [Micromonospora sp. U56]MBQ0892006.1 hypothetical protein [Micromonospora sp. U56]
MDDRRDDRLRGGLLAAAALLAVTAGGWWWWAGAPATGRRGVAVGTSPPPRGVVPSRSPETLNEVLAAHPDAAVRVRIDGSGRVIEATELPGDTDDLALPRFTDTLLRERLTLIPGQKPVRRESLADGARHLLQYRCTGPGELLISIIQGPTLNTAQSTCDGELGQLDLPHPMEPEFLTPEQVAPTRIELSAVGPRPVEVAAQLVALP